MKNKTPKRKLANKMLSNLERKQGKSMFDSKQWNARKEARALKLKGKK